MLKKKTQNGTHETSLGSALPTTYFDGDSFLVVAAATYSRICGVLLVLVHVRCPRCQAIVRGLVSMLELYGCLVEALLRLLRGGSKIEKQRKKKKEQR